MDVSGAALVTGAAGGQGRSHCLGLAAAGYGVVAVDICADVASVPYPQSSSDQLAATVAAVEAAGGAALGVEADVRDHAAMQDAVAAGRERFGRLDAVCANAGVIQLRAATEITPEDWSTVVGTNLTGTWNTVSTALGPMTEQGSGSIVIIGSVAGLKGTPGMVHYAAAKAGLVGLTRSLAVELGPAGVRVNGVAPTLVDTQMLHWRGSYAPFRPDLDAPTVDDVVPVLASMHPLGVPWVEPRDVTEVIVWLCSDEARYVTGAMVPVDAGALIA